MDRAHWPFFLWFGKHFWPFPIHSIFLRSRFKIEEMLKGFWGYMIGNMIAVFFVLSHNGMVRSQDLFWWKWLTGQAMAALNYKLNLRVMEQSGADQNGMGGIPTCLGAHNTIQNCRKMHLDMTIPNSLIWLPWLAGVSERCVQNDSRNLYHCVIYRSSGDWILYLPNSNIRSVCVVNIASSLNAPHRTWH